MTGPDELPRNLRRRRWPVLSLIAALLVGAAVIWFQAVKPPAKVSNACNPPGPAPTTSSQTSRSRTSAVSAAGTAASASASATTSTSPATPTTLGQYLDRNTLRDIRPANPESLKVNVFNASKQVGMAKTVSDELRRVGFKAVGTVNNDPLYPAQDLRCPGQIRYGQAGLAGARTMLMILPCSQLVMDGRLDDTVDVTVGALYKYDETSKEVQNQLAQIVLAARPPAVIEGRTAAPRTLPAIPALPQATCPS